MPVYQLIHDIPLFPPVEEAEGNGLLAVGGDLTKERLLAAYRQGIFPWYECGQPILWWCPDPRLVLFPKELRVSRSGLLPHRGSRGRPRRHSGCGSGRCGC